MKTHIAGDHERMVSIANPETGRIQRFLLDNELDLGLVQELNDLAFAYGAAVFSTCAGHIAEYPGLCWNARVTFASYHLSADRLGQRQADICMQRLATHLLAAGIQCEITHDDDFDPHRRRPARYKHAVIRLIAWHPIRTPDDPLAAQRWWIDLVDRLRSGTLAFALLDQELEQRGDQKERSDHDVCPRRVT